MTWKSAVLPKLLHVRTGAIALLGSDLREKPFPRPLLLPATLRPWRLFRWNGFWRWIVRSFIYFSSASVLASLLPAFTSSFICSLIADQVAGKISICGYNSEQKQTSLTTTTHIEHSWMSLWKQYNLYPNVPPTAKTHAITDGEEWPSLAEMWAWNTFPASLYMANIYWLSYGRKTSKQWKRKRLIQRRFFFC